ncbi:MAG TPA: substrate-binding domain-containing protein, partial [Telluria sp.]|nr:substrate-binding domain-containing protein [Telluria sp.]
TGFMMGLEYLTGGTMAIRGRKLKVIVKDDQSKPDLGRTLLAEAYGDDKVDIAVGTSSSGSAIAMLPVALEYKKVLVVEPAVADSITGDKWNRYIFRTARSSMQEGLAAASTLKTGSVAFLAQDYAFGRDTVKASKEALSATGSKAKVVHEEYAPPAATDFTASAQRIFDALKDKPQPRVLSIVWAGPHPMNKIADMKPERYGIVLAPNGNILPVLKTWKNYVGTEGAIYYYYAFPKNKMNDWLVAEHTKRFKAPPDMFTAGGFAAASAVVTALTKAGSGDSEKLVAAMEGMDFETPKGKMTFRKEDHQAMQAMYHFRIKKDQKNEWDLLELVREIPASELPVPVKNKR